ncbi:MAG: bifunctional DNA-formamidopyrimidine glycosylase/DNA-(apurinic or apyrimidinic site) lyase [Rhodospirillaceae bacterium]|jgi:formamidopyrimidine-DNA glycosylase|nr:bifunctional DNA-formamidopyrimidine glycosylase/DNA-(apurinic or apyrimidinic site) lyase [Rhodospirillaceae bacterium]
MPELPEVETVRRGLAPVLEGAKLRRVIARRPDLRFPLPDGFGQRLTGRRVNAVRRRAKYLLIEIDDGSTVLAHLGMSGRFRIFEGAPPPEEPHDHVILETDAGVVIRYNDPRRFGFIDIIDDGLQGENKFLAGLGPEPLGSDFGSAALVKRLEGKAAPLKTALLDQRVVAGLGNIYVCEALHRAGLSPRRKSHTVGPARAGRLVDAIKVVLENAIAAGGSSLRDHRQTNGELGYFQHAFQVYGREGDACSNCGPDHTVRRIVQSGRSTFYCPHCQR